MNDSHDGQTAEHDSRPTVTVAEAAHTLGVTVDSVRSRLHRGTLEGWKDDNIWRVRLPEGVSLSTVNSEPRQSPTGSVTADDSARQSVENVVDNALIDQIRSENEYLRERLEEADRQRDNLVQQLAEERRRADVLQREALSRIEALTATVGDSQPAEHTPGEISPEPERTPKRDTTHEAVESPQTSESPSLSVIAWLRRLLSS